MRKVYRKITFDTVRQLGLALPGAEEEARTEPPRAPARRAGTRSANNQKKATSFMKSLSRFQPFLLSALRIVAAYVYLAHGTQKLFNFPVTTPHPPIALASLMGAAGIIECLGGTLMLLGLFTRPVAFFISGQMAYAYFTQHVPRGVWYFPILNGGDLPVLLCFVWLFFGAAGPGPISVDVLRGAK